MSNIILLGVILLVAKSTARISTMHFGCNASGPESDTQLNADLRYSTMVFEFRHEMLVQPWNNEEIVLEKQADSLVKFAKQQKRTIPEIFVYRNINAGSMFKNQAKVMFDPAYDGMFLKPPSTDPTLNISWRAFDFRQLNASRFYLDTIVAEAANESVRLIF
jgi:hypothetical protein